MPLTGSTTLRCASRRAKVSVGTFVLVAGTVCAFAGGASGQSDGVDGGVHGGVLSPGEELPPGVELTPEEAMTADVVIVPDPGQTLTAEVTPGDCEDPDNCAYTVQASGEPTTFDTEDSSDPEMESTTSRNSSARRRAARRRAARRKFTALNGATVRHIRVRRTKRPRPRTKRLARAAAYYAYWKIVDDHICSIYGCGAWEMQLNSHAWCNGHIAWGDTRAYRSGWVNKYGTKSNGYSISTDRLGFVGNGTYRSMYATHDGTVSAMFKGFPAARTHYLHRHYPGNCGRAWLVAK